MTLWSSGSGTGEPVRNSLGMTGIMKTIEQRAKRVSAKAGKPAGRAVRKRAAARFQPSSDRYRDLMEMSPDAIYVSQRDIIVEANQAAADLFGLKNGRELVGRPLKDFAHPDFHRLIDERARELYSKATDLPLVEEKLLRPDGAEIYVEVKSRSFRHRGRLLVQSVARDITGRKKLEQELVSFKRQMEYVLEATRTAVVVINGDLDVVYASPHWKSRFGEVNGRKCHDYFRQSPSPCRPCRILEAIGSRTPSIIEKEEQAGAGRFSQVHIVPFRDETGEWMAAEFTIDITDLKRIQTELARRQRELLTLLDSIPAGVFFKDVQGRYLLANRNFCEVAGMAQDQLAGKTDAELLSPEAAERVRINEARVLAGNETQFFGETEVVQGGRKLTVETRMVPVRDEQGTALGIIGIHYNVTERKRAEERERLSALQWQTTFDAMGDGIALLDGEGVVRRCNEALGRILRKPCREIVGMPSHQLLPLGNEAPDFMEELRKNRQRFGRELKLEDQWLSLSFDPVADPSGEPKGSVFVLKDVTEIRRAQELARLMMTAIEQLDEGVMMADPSGRITYFNPAAERITGYAKAEVIGRTSVVPRERADKQFTEFWNKTWEQVAKDGIWFGSKTARRKDGTLYEQELVVSAVNNPKGERISSLVVIRDVTEQKRLQAIAEAANNMNNIGFIFSGVRHEMGNPVNSIKVATSLLGDGYDSLDDGARKEYIGRITSDVQRLEALLKVLHSFSMFENLSLGPVELCAFIRDLMPTIEPDFAKAGIGLRCQFPEGGCRVLADRRALYQIVVNLMTNAFNALAGREGPSITVSVICVGESHRLEVEDNGSGMTREVKENIFKPFYTTRPGGTGLGLVICQKLVLAMNGYIDVDSDPGRGTRVAVSLPGDRPASNQP